MKDDKYSTIVGAITGQEYTTMPNQQYGDMNTDGGLGDWMGRNLAEAEKPTMTKSILEGKSPYQSIVGDKASMESAIDSAIPGTGFTRGSVKYVNRSAQEAANNILDSHKMFSGKTNIPDYDSFYNPTKDFGEYNGVEVKSVLMSPDEYLEAAEKGFKESGYADKFIPEADKLESLRGATDKVPNPTLQYNYKKSGEATFGQEGRHRAVVAKEKGIDAIPVMIMSNGERSKYMTDEVKEKLKSSDRVLADYKYRNIQTPELKQIARDMPKMSPQGTYYRKLKDFDSSNLKQGDLITTNQPASFTPDKELAGRYRGNTLIEYSARPDTMFDISDTNHAEFMADDTLKLQVMNVRARGDDTIVTVAAPTTNLRKGAKEHRYDGDSMDYTNDEVVSSEVSRLKGKILKTKSPGLKEMLQRKIKGIENEKVKSDIAKELTFGQILQGEL